MKGIYKIISEVLSIDQDSIRLKHHLFDDLGSDSLDIVELIMYIEEEYDIEIPDNIAEEFQTVKDIIEYVEQQERATDYNPEGPTSYEPEDNPSDIEKDYE